jgi:hypothetical protein
VNGRTRSYTVHSIGVAAIARYVYPPSKKYRPDAGPA